MRSDLLNVKYLSHDVKLPCAETCVMTEKSTTGDGEEVEGDGLNEGE